MCNQVSSGGHSVQFHCYWRILCKWEDAVWSSCGSNCEFSVILWVLDNMSKQGNAVQDDATVQKLLLLQRKPQSVTHCSDCKLNLGFQLHDWTLARELLEHVSFTTQTPRSLLWFPFMINPYIVVWLRRMSWSVVVIEKPN